MNRKAIASAIVALSSAMSLVAGAAHAETFGALYDDVTARDARAQSQLEDAHTQYLLGNRPESCDALERARVNFETAYGEVEAIRDLVANGGDLEGHSANEVMAWVISQEKSAVALGGEMQDFWQEHCR